MKKIVLLTQNLDVGGVQKVVSNLLEFFKNSYNIVLILVEDNKKTFFQVPQNIDIITMKYKKLDITKKKAGEDIFTFRINELTNILEKEQPEIVISFEDYNNLILLSSSYQCKKIIVSLVTMKDIYKNEKVHLLNQSFYYEKIKTLYPQAYKSISVSNAISQNLKELFNIDSVVIHNDINTKQLNHLSKEPIIYSNYILSVGRLHPQKGQIDLLKAFTKISSRINHTLVIIGDGKEELNLKNYVKEQNLEKRVIFHGSDSNPYKYMKNAELFIFPSLYEGHPFTLIEAMIFNTPIIAYNFDGLNEIISTKDNICEVGDIKCLSNKILTYLSNKAIIKENIIKMNQASSAFTSDHMVQAYLQIIENK